MDEEDKYDWPDGLDYFQKSNSETLIRNIKQGTKILKFPDLEAEERRRKIKILIEYAESLDW